MKEVAQESKMVEADLTSVSFVQVTASVNDEVLSFKEAIASFSSFS